MTMTSGCLCEPQQGEVAHNAVSRRFVTHPANLGWVRFMTDFYLPVSSSMAEATEKWGDSEKKNETAANFAMKTPLTTFDFITGSREYNRYFSAYMKATFPVEGTTVRHLLADFDWARLENGLVVHVGRDFYHRCVAAKLTLIRLEDPLVRLASPWRKPFLSFVSWCKIHRIRLKSVGHF